MGVRDATRLCGGRDELEGDFSAWLQDPHIPATHRHHLLFQHLPGAERSCRIKQVCTSPCMHAHLMSIPALSHTPAPSPLSCTPSVQPKLEMQQGKAGLEKFLISEELWRKGLMW